MKKALVVFLALALVAGVFADEPVAELGVAEFTGNASVTWGADLDTEKTGFSNAAEASLKVTLVKGGDKSTSGDGIWAELKIKTNDLKTEANNADSVLKDGKPELDVAKLHFGPVYVGIKSGDTTVGGFNLPSALGFEQAGKKLDAVGKDQSQGITIGYSAGDIFSIDVDLRSQAKYNDNYAAALEITSKPISGLTAKAGFSYGIEAARTATTLVDDLYAMSASVAYKMNIGDKGMYIEPGVAYTNNLNEVVVDPAKPNEKSVTKGTVGVGVLFGFSDETGKDNPGLPLFDDANSKKSNAGASIVALFNLDQNRKYTTNATGAAITAKDAPIAIPFYFDVWTGSKLVPNLNAAAFVRTADITAYYLGQEGASSLTLNTGVGVKYDVKLNDLTITPKAGMTLDIANAKAYQFALAGQVAKVEAGVDVAGLINNTTVSVLYKVGPFSKATTTVGTVTTTTSVETRGTLDFTVKIAF